MHAISMQRICQTLLMFLTFRRFAIRWSFKELRRYNDISPFELFVISCPLDSGLEIFVGVPSERYPAHLESRFLPGRHYAKFNLQGKLIIR